MPLQLRRISYPLGAEVTGIDLSSKIDDATIAEIRQASLDHLLLCFPKQNLKWDQVLAFGERFGAQERVARDMTAKNLPGLGLLTNTPIDGKPWDGYKNGQNWHSDKSNTLRPTEHSFVYCHQTPNPGGDTMFANMYLAYDTLSEPMKKIADNLNAVHQRTIPARFEAAGRLAGHSVAEEQEAIAIRDAGYIPTVQPAVVVHPETGKKAIYLGSRVSHFAGMSHEESAPLLTFLNAHAVSYEFVYRHRWSVGDLVMWDNRCLLHVALSDYDLRNDVRIMYRAAVAGVGSGRPYTSDDEPSARVAVAT